MTTITNAHRFSQEATTALALGGRQIPGKAGWAATIETDPGAPLSLRKGDQPIGATVKVSRLDGESRWHVDGTWMPGRAMPLYWNGEGSRCTLPTFADDYAEALDQAVEQARLDALETDGILRVLR